MLAFSGTAPASSPARSVRLARWTKSGRSGQAPHTVHIGLVAGLGRLHHADGPAGSHRGRRDRRRHNGFPDPRVGTGHDDRTGPHLTRHGRLARITSIACSKSARATPTFTVNRSRERLSGVDGGRKQPTATPRSRQAVAHATAASGRGAVTDSTPAAGSGTSRPAA